MGINSVSTYAIFQSTLNDVSSTEANLTDLQEQLSSGQKASDFQGLGNQTTQYLNLQAEISKTNLYINNNTLVSSTLDATNNALTSITNIATDIQNLISSQQSGVANSSVDFNAQLNAQWQALTGQLNTTNNAPVHIFGRRHQRARGEHADVSLDHGRHAQRGLLSGQRPGHDGALAGRRIVYL